MQSELFSESGNIPAACESIASGAIILRGFASGCATDLILEIERVAATAPFRHMVTRGGFPMSVAMTNCGPLGWVSDRQGYRYSAVDPETGRPWPRMPELFSNLAVTAAAAANFLQFEPNACLINRYEPGARMGLHQDRDEQNLSAPIVSVSLGLPAVFQFGGESRKERPRRHRLESGDVVVWGGPARLTFHGIAPLADGEHPLTGRCRLNLTFRQTT